jgi:hypothetical protein
VFRAGLIAQNENVSRHPVSGPIRGAAATDPKP